MSDTQRTNEELGRDLNAIIGVMRGLKAQRLLEKFPEPGLAIDVLELIARRLREPERETIHGWLYDFLEEQGVHVKDQYLWDSADGLIAALASQPAATRGEP